MDERGVITPEYALSLTLALPVLLVVLFLADVAWAAVILITNL